jgi:acetyl-CoA carboxylase biotin carboxyl carrier protein
MDGNRQHPRDMESFSHHEHPTDGSVSVAQLQHLVQLLDESDVSEIEVKRAEEGMRLVLRKAEVRASDASELYQVLAPSTGSAASKPAPVDTRHTITAPLVGIFHPWSKPKGSASIAVGDHVKPGQLVGMIQSLNIINDVESPFGGCIVEILTQDGQAVEYGQQLVVIDSAEEA